MPGETEKDVSPWTTDSLHQHLQNNINNLEKYTERRFTDQDKAVQAALQAAKEAVLKAENAADKRFEAANEVKATFSDELARKLERTEYDSNHKALEDKIDALTDRMNRNDGKSSGLTAGWGYLVGAVGLASLVAGIIVAFTK